MDPKREDFVVVDIYKRECVKDWHIEAQNGDRQECKAGEFYTTSAPNGDGTVTVFSRFWVKAPESIFTPQPCPTCGRSG